MKSRAEIEARIEKMEARIEKIERLIARIRRAVHYLLLLIGWFLWT